MTLDSDSYSLSLATPLPGTKMWDIVEKNNLFHESYNFDTGLPTLVSIKPHDISDVDLKELVENTNKKLNYKSSQKRQLQASFSEASLLSVTFPNSFPVGEETSQVITTSVLPLRDGLTLIVPLTKYVASSFFACC